MTYNLRAPYTIRTPCDLDDLSGWYHREILDVEPAAVRQILELVCVHLDQLVEWPARALLLWQGCDRIRPEGARQRIHDYPADLKSFAKQEKVSLDRRPNGPAIAAFNLARGRRPKRRGNLNAWSIHHLYSGKFPYVDRDATTHAARHGLHFTQAAGLVAVHPVADALCDESPAFTWLLRASSFKRFGYDPDGVFSDTIDDFGFLPGCHTTIQCPDA